MTRVVCMALVALAGCSLLGDGDIAVRVTGEQGAREGFPFVPGDTHDDENHDHGEAEVAFEDGWTLTFDRYLASVADLEVASTDGDTAARSEAVYVVDLASGDPVIEELVGLPARRWDAFSFAVRAPEDGETVRPAEGVTDDDVARMRADGINYWIEGVATKDDRTVHFAWGLSNPVEARECTSGTDGTAGVVVRANATTEAELTFHVEHMFWDWLGSEQTRLRFDAIAAMADADGEVAWASLADQMLTDLRDLNGDPLVDAAGNRVVYDPGSSGLMRNDLQEFILAATRTQAHLDGEGLCSLSSL